MTKIGPSPSWFSCTSESSSQLSSVAGSSARRLRRKRMSTTTSVPASCRKAPSGNRIAPTRSAMPAMRARARASALSIVPAEVTKAASPPASARDRLADKIVVEPEPLASIERIGADDAIGKRWIADCKIERRRQRYAGEILVENSGARLKQPDDPGGDGIELDAGDAASVSDRLRHQCRKQAGPDAGFEDAPALEAQAEQTGPDGADDEFRREMGILRAAGKRCVVGARDSGLEVSAELVPTRCEGLFAWPTKDAVGKIRSAETGEADELSLFLRRGSALLVDNLRRQPDRRDVCGCPVLPAFRQAAIGRKSEVLGPRFLGGLIGCRPLQHQPWRGPIIDRTIDIDARRRGGETGG
ncbi:hypothetical protein AJ87_08970 [Rhizobium yanglingense]|nr:hypothetical protein AJ87_08970 [Rhizobium yanglingense]